MIQQLQLQQQINYPFQRCNRLLSHSTVTPRCTFLTYNWQYTKQMSVKIKITVHVWSVCTFMLCIRLMSLHSTQVWQNHCTSGRDLYSRLSRLQTKQDPYKTQSESHTWSSLALAVCICQCKHDGTGGPSTGIVYVFGHIMSWCLKLTMSSLHISRHQL